MSKVPQDVSPDIRKRPGGALVWLHCPLPERRQAAEQLALRILAMEEGLVHVLLTLPDHHPVVRAEDAHPQQPGLIRLTAPTEGDAAIARFLDHWQPDALIWLSGQLRQPLLSAAAQRKRPMMLAEAREDALDEPRWLMRATPARRRLTRFDSFAAQTGNAARRLARLGADTARIEITGPLQEGCSALPCDENLRSDLAAELAGRPLWLAVRTDASELDQLLEAHRSASRLAHRLLLILAPADEEARALAATRLDRQGWRWQAWSPDHFPADETQVLLLDPEADMGLWYRISPVCFLSQSLQRGLPGLDPRPAAAHGSAILHGLHTGEHRAAYAALSEAGGARHVRDAEALSQALMRLLSPDQAAAMASAAWTIATDGAEATDQAAAWAISALENSGAL